MTCSDVFLKDHWLLCLKKKKRKSSVKIEVGKIRMIQEKINGGGAVDG